eukprot:scaffold138654_cov46-Cyclotella_meneghiniana.AAC.1
MAISSYLPTSIPCTFQAVNNSTHILMMMHQKQASAAPQPAPKATVKKVHQIAKLRGYAGLHWNERLPEFWYEALTTTKENEHRRMLTERVVTWMKAKGHSILKHGLYFTKGQIEDIVQAKFSTPNGAQGVLEGAYKSLTIIGLLQWSPEEKIAIRNMEENEEAAIGLNPSKMALTKIF